MRHIIQSTCVRNLQYYITQHREAYTSNILISIKRQRQVFDDNDHEQLDFNHNLWRSHSKFNPSPSGIPHVQPEINTASPYRLSLIEFGASAHVEGAMEGRTRQTNDFASSTSLSTKITRTWKGGSYMYAWSVINAIKISRV